MHKSLCLTIIALIGALSVCQADVILKSKPVKGASNMQPNIKEVVVRTLQKFQQFNDLLALEAATNHVSAMQADKENGSATELNSFHAEKLSLWLLILSSIDQKVDPKFDLKDTPMLSVAPPEGAQVPAGSNPQTIKDNELRQKYIESIKTNQEKTLEYNFQYKLLKLNSLATGDAQMYIRGVHLKTVDAKSRYLQIVEQSVVAPQRKAGLKNLATTIEK
jgi:hypothetical protein